MKKKALCLLLCALLCLTILPAGAFSDLTGSYLWASEAAQNMVDQNIMTPKSETEFGAADLVGEAELVQILNAAFGGGLAETQNAAPVTRELMCSYIVNAQGLVADETADDEIVYATFRDANQISPEHLESVKIALQNKVITGYEDNTFRPKNFVTKAELASLLNKLVGTSEEVPQKIERGERKMEILMLYDCDHGNSINTRPDNGWWPLNPEYPDPPQISQDSICRTTTPLLGTYDSGDTKVIRQHLYWLSAMGVTALKLDFTNCMSPRDTTEHGQIMRGYNSGMLKVLEKQLKLIPQITEFECPKTFPELRLMGEETFRDVNFDGNQFDALQMLLDDCYALYEKYPDGWYKFDDGTDRANLPFIDIFADWTLLNEWAKSGITFDDPRFNIRWSNGFLALQQNTHYLNDDGVRVIPKDLPYWVFIENEPMPDKEGYYRPMYKEGADGKPEQMVTWASVWKGGSVWDGMLNQVDGKYPIQRYTEPVYDIMPKLLIINRWAYPLAYPREPQEGLSREDSTHIEPNVDWGFKIFNMVTNETYGLNGWKKQAPPKPVVTNFDQRNMTLGVDLNGYPLEYRISATRNLDNAEWDFINVSKGGMKLPESMKASGTIYIQTRNSFGESPIGSYKLVIDEHFNDNPANLVTVIETADQLAEMTGSGTYELGATIDLSDTDWTPIEGFSGTFNGNADKGYSIDGLNGIAANGLFRVLGEGAVVKNLVINDANLTAAGAISGVIAARAVTGATVQDCGVFNSTLTATTHGGGIVGANEHAFIKNCVFTGKITGLTAIGGIAGYSEFANITDCYVNAVIEADSWAGGILGMQAGADDGTNGVKRCIAKGEVKGGSGMGFGGICGIPYLETPDNWPSVIEGCFAYQDKISGTSYGRVASYASPYMRKNYAISTLKAGANDKTETGADGADIDAAAAYNWSNFEKAGFSPDIWSISQDKIMIKTIPAMFQ